MSVHSFLYMNITATHINYLEVCKRKLWLFSHGIEMEHTSDLVSDGKVIEEESYRRRTLRYSQINLSATYNGVNLSGKIDFFDSVKKIIHETKRSDKVEEAHINQIRFYLWLLELNNIEVNKGLIEYPKLRKTESVILEEKDRGCLMKKIELVQVIVNNDCPAVINAKICNSCSYRDFCYSGEGIV